MNNLLKIAHHIPVNDEVPVISVNPVSLPAPDRGMDLEVRISAPVAGKNMPVILFSHGHGPSLYIPSADGYLRTLRGVAFQNGLQPLAGIIAPSGLRLRRVVTLLLAIRDPRQPFPHIVRATLCTAVLRCRRP